jgi:hypothetical protein
MNRPTPTSDEPNNRRPLMGWTGGDRFQQIGSSGAKCRDKLAGNQAGLVGELVDDLEPPVDGLGGRLLIQG